MFKNVKGLIVAGLLVIGSTGFAFADEGCLFGNVGVHGEDGVHRKEEADLIEAEGFNATMQTVKDKENDGYILEETTVDGYEKAYKIIADVNYNNLIDAGEAVVETIAINFADGVVEEKGWLPELAPGTGDTLVAGGAVVAALAAGGLLVVNRKNKKDE